MSDQHRNYGLAAHGRDAGHKVVKAEKAKREDDDDDDTIGGVQEDPRVGEDRRGAIHDADPILTSYHPYQQQTCEVSFLPTRLKLMTDESRTTTNIYNMGTHIAIITVIMAFLSRPYRHPLRGGRDKLSGAGAKPDRSPSRRPCHAARPRQSARSERSKHQQPRRTWGPRWPTPSGATPPASLPGGRSLDHHLLMAHDHRRLRPASPATSSKPAPEAAKKKPIPGSKEASDDKLTATSTTATVSSTSHGLRSALSRSRNSNSSIISPQPALAAGPRGQDAQDIIGEGIGGDRRRRRLNLARMVPR
ncbi:hypothetical protein NW752_007643 [Fusarium irregulare]|nr:hypothetical protein NW752_007643 [Fusarium irregulare]